LPLRGGGLLQRLGQLCRSAALFGVDREQAQDDGAQLRFHLKERGRKNRGQLMPGALLILRALPGQRILAGEELAGGDSQGIQIIRRAGGMAGRGGLEGVQFQESGLRGAVGRSAGVERGRSEGEGAREGARAEICQHSGRRSGALGCCRP